MSGWQKIQLAKLIERDGILYDEYPYRIDFNRVAMTQLGAATFGSALVETIRNFKFDSIGGSIECLPLVMAATLRIPHCRGFCVDVSEPDVWGSICEGDGIILLVDVAKGPEPILAIAKTVKDLYPCEIKLIVAAIEMNKGATTVRESGYNFVSLLNINDLKIRLSCPDPGC